MGDSFIDTNRLYGNLIPASVATGLFVLASLPTVYGWTIAAESRLTDMGTPPCPSSTLSTRLIHMLLYYGVLYGISYYLESRKEEALRLPPGVIAKQTFYRTLLFFVLTSPESYNLTGKAISDLSPNNCPSLKGVFVHAVLFLVVVTLTMYFPPDQASERFVRVQLPKKQ